MLLVCENPYVCLFAVGVVTRGCAVCLLESDPPIVCRTLFTNPIVLTIITTFAITTNISSIIIYSGFQPNQKANIILANVVCFNME